MTIPPLEPEDGETASTAFEDYLKRESLWETMDADRYHALAGAFLHGFAAGSGNATGKARAEVEKLRAVVAQLRREHASAV